MLAWRRGFYGWFNLGFLTLTYALTAGLFYTLAINLPLAGKDLGWTAAEYGAGSTAYLVAVGVGSLLAGWVVPRFGARATMLAFTALPGLSVLLLSFVTQVWQAVALCALLGVGNGLGVQIAAPTVASQWFLRRRSTALAILLTSSTVMSIVWSQLQVALLAAFGSWRSAVLIEGLIALLAPFLVLLFVCEKPADLGQTIDAIPLEELDRAGVDEDVEALGRTHKTRRDWTRGQALRTSAFWFVFFSICLEGFVYNGLIAHQVTVFEDQGFDLTVALAAVGFLGLLGGVGRLIGGVVSDRVEPRFVLAFFQALLSVGLLCLVVLHGWPGSIFLYVIFVGMAAGEVYLMSSVLYTNYYGTKAYPALVGLLFPAQAILFSGSAPTVLGVVIDATGDTTTILVGLALVNVVAAVLGFLARPPREAAVAPDLTLTVQNQPRADRPVREGER
jgi:MFS family permease